MKFSQEFTEAAFKMAKPYDGAYIKDIVYNAPRDNRESFYISACIYSKDGVLMLSSDLASCVARMTYIAECLAYWKNFSEVTDIITP